MIGNHKMTIEPKESFPYQSPSSELRTEYQHIFDLKEPLDDRFVKRFLDIALGSILLLFSAPILVFLKIGFIVEGLLVPENKGRMFFYYHAISKGKIIKKYKIRLIKEKFIDQELAAKHDWLAYSGEWNENSRTIMGEFVKKYYLDELPQCWSVFCGDMSLVGPRPISIMHYERDLAQGNISRKILKGGLLGLGHIRKGTAEMGDPKYEYEYIDHYIKDNSWQLCQLDLEIIIKGLRLMSKGGGF